MKTTENLKKVIFEWTNGAIVGAGLGELLIAIIGAIGALPIMSYYGMGGLNDFLDIVTPSLPITMALFATVMAFECGTKDSDMDGVVSLGELEINDMA